MKLNIAAVCLIALTFFSCKQESKPVTPAEVKETSKTFDVTLDVTATKDDTFHLFYTDDGSINFNEKNSVWVEIRGKETSQQVVFKLPEDVLPTHLRVDFGINKNQENMIINNFKMSYLDKNFEAKGPLFFTYFYPNLECTNIDKDKGIIMPVKKGNTYSGPMFYPQIALTEEINKLVK